MNKAVLIASLALLAGASAVSAQTPIAYWRFPVASPANNWEITFPFNADSKVNSGAARITTNATVWNGQFGGLNATQQGAFQYFGGSTLNALPGDAAGQALAIRGLGTNAAPDTNGKYVQFQFDTTGFNNIQMTWAERGTTAGPTGIAISISTDGTNFTSAGSFVPTNNSNFNLRTVNLSAFPALNNAATAYVRYTFTGYTSSSGGYRFDNVQVIPTPGAVALLGLGGLAAARRRRA